MVHKQLRSGLATVVLGVGLVLSGCGPVDESEVTEGAELGAQEQATYGGDIGSRLGRPAVTGSTVGMTDEVTPSCAYSVAPDVSYIWKAPRTGVFSFIADGFDTVLQVRALHGAVLGCNDDEYSGTLRSALQLSVVAGEAYVVTVDGYGSSAGNFSLSIFGNCGACNTPPNGCYFPDGTCNLNGSCSYDWACDSGEICRFGRCSEKY